MYNTSILDSNRLINLKSQHGLKIVNSSSLSVFSSQSKLRKAMVLALNPFLHKMDLENLIDKVVDRCDDTDTIEAVTNYFNAVTPQEFIKEAQGKIRPFFKLVKNFGNTPTTEFTGNVKFSA